MQITLKNIGEVIRESKLDEWLVYLKMASGHHGAAFLLRRVIWWTANPAAKDRGGWFYKSKKEWEEETGLTESRLNTARAKLPFLLYEVRNVGYKKRTYYKLDVKAFLAAFNKLLSSLTGKAQSDPSHDDAANDDAAHDGTPEKPAIDHQKNRPSNVAKFDFRLPDFATFKTSTYSNKKTAIEKTANKAALSFSNQEKASEMQNNNNQLEQVISEDSPFNTPRIIFESAMEQLKIQMSSGTYGAYLMGAKLTGYEPATNTFAIECKSKMAADYCQSRLIRNWRRLFSDLSGHELESINFEFYYIESDKPEFLRGSA